MQCSMLCNAINMQYAIVYILPLLALTRPKSVIIHKTKHTSKQRNKTRFPFTYNVLQNNKIELITQSIALLKMVHTNKYRNDPTFYFVESGKPIPCLCVGNATKSMLQKAPMATGNTVKISRASFEGDGKKQ